MSQAPNAFSPSRECARHRAMGVILELMLCLVLGLPTTASARGTQIRPKRVESQSWRHRDSRPDRPHAPRERSLRGGDLRLREGGRLHGCERGHRCLRTPDLPLRDPPRLRADHEAGISLAVFQRAPLSPSDSRPITDRPCPSCCRRSWQREGSAPASGGSGRA